MAPKIKNMCPCGVCNRNVHNNQKGLYCVSCCTWIHLKCTTLSSADYLAVGLDPSSWFCSACTSQMFPFNNIDDDFDFECCLFNNNNCNNIVNTTQIKNVQQLKFTNKMKLCNSDIDPDKFYYNQFDNIENTYYLEDDFNNMIIKESMRTNFSILHLNARSLIKNLKTIVDYLNSLKHKFTVIAVTETWAKKDTEDRLQIPGYNRLTEHRPSTKDGGGVALFTLDSLCATKRVDLMTYSNSNFEMLFMDLNLPGLPNKTIGVVYRPPDSNLDLFMSGFMCVLSVLTKSNADCYIAGDFNIDLLKWESHAGTSDFINSLYLHAMIPAITKPTRFSKDSSTLIDNILINKPNNASISGLLVTDISDHLPVFYIAKAKSHINSPKSKLITISTRDFSENNINKLRLDLEMVDWTSLFDLTDVNLAYSHFTATFQGAFDKNMPLKQKTLKVHSNAHKPWISSGIAKSIRRKNHLYRCYLAKRSASSNDKYKKYKNKLTTIIRMAEKLYYQNKFDLARDSISKTWHVIKSIINTDYIKPNIKEIKTNNSITADKKLIANTFNDYFVNIGPNLAAKIPVIDGDVTSYINGNFKDSMVVNDTDVIEISKLVTLLNKSPSTGIDGIPSIIVKNTISAIAQPLSFVINLSLNSGQFPDLLKVAKVIPVYKADDKLLTTNYRPISILPIFSKIFERVMYNRLLSYLDAKKILTQNQYGFREKHSTYMALLSLVDDISEEMNNKNYSIGIFIDLSKAFDTINHKLLIAKLNHYGIRGMVLDWFVSYLTNRTQTVNINNTSSAFLSVKCGVPQGSILGPLLFLIYINDIINASDLAKCIIFADDTNLFFKHKNLSTLYNIINVELNKISDWFKLNKLSLNVKKTSYILFQSGNKKINNAGLTISIDGITIEQADNTKFLGVIINSKLNWNDHIKVICNKISKNIGILFRTRNNLTPHTLLMLYRSLIQPYIEYCNIVWAAGESISLTNLFRKQKKAIRTITFAKWNAHTGPIFNRLHIPTLYQTNKFQTACFVYKSINRMLPFQFSNIFISNNEIHHYDTRNKHNIHQISHRINVRAKSIRVYGAKVWNALDKFIIDTPTFSLFKSRFKQLM
jgi:hypothetical protein